MYLKSLEVHGFKSFADRLVFEFHDGITAIVGPNGSGKSNVADAVRWVLGEQSAKQLRGSRMEDVIFAGTQHRRPLGFAYVAITITNEDKKLDVPYEEVKIARRVYRSGESEYLLNGAPCRLRDVQELFFDTGIGKEGYSIIGQGQIDKILSGKPEERRELFDEAAGIVKYKRRKAAAEKSLEEEELNLVRIEDILGELEKQLEPLEEQANKARDFLKYRDELKSLDVEAFLIEYERTKNEIKDNDGKLAIIDADLEAARQNFKKSKEEYAGIEERLDACGRDIEAKAKTLSEGKVRSNNYENEIKILNERINAIRQSEKHYGEQIENRGARLDVLEDELKKSRAQLIENDEEISRNGKAKRENDKKLKAVSDKIEMLSKDVAARQSEIFDAMNRASDMRVEQNRLKTLIEQNAAKKAEYAKRMLKGESDAAILNEELEKQGRLMEDADARMRVLSDESAALEGTISKIDEKKASLEDEYKKTQQRFHMENSRLASLKNMVERYDGFSSSIKRVMSQKGSAPGIVGVVADVIKVKKEYETAIETALGGNIQNIITEDERAAKEMIQFLKKNKYGRATFLPLTTVKARPARQPREIMEQKGVIGAASSLVWTEARFSGLIEHLLGRFIVVDNIDNAIAIAGKYRHALRIVTVEGDLLNPGGSMSGGAFKNGSNLLGRRREMEVLEKSAAKLKESLSEISKKIEALDSERAGINEKLSENEKNLRELMIKKNTAGINFDRTKKDLDESGEKLNKMRDEAREIEEKTASLNEKMRQTTFEISEADEKNKSREENIAFLNGQLENERSHESGLAEKNSEYVARAASLAGKGKYIMENIERVKKEHDVIKKELDEILKNRGGIDAEIEKKRGEIKDAKAKAMEINAEMESLSDEMEKKKKERDLLSAMHGSCLAKREELSDLISELDKERFRLEGQKEKLDEKISSYVEYMWDQYEITYHAAAEMKRGSNLSYEQMKERMSQLREKVKSLGDVNVNAIEQHAELVERYELLSGQRDDLTQAAGKLKGIIEELDVEMRDQFETQFAKIREQFDGVFKKLFGGGRGSIELVEGEDVLLSGISIIAQPPGKKLQNMMQLSGGEKALTAIALLFAIQSLKPSPFCLLDEIEAALDDSNVIRYANYLHTLTKDTQFIVITHRRGTMNAADILYGITMQEKGVSTLVSVNLD